MEAQITTTRYRPTPVQPALVRALSTTQDFAAFMTGEPAPHGLSGLFDNSFSKLYRDRYKARLSATLQRMRLDPSAQNIIVQALDRAAEELQRPGVLLDANPWVSPRRQASLLKWMRQKLRDQKNIEDLMPPHPAAADFYWTLRENLFRRCQRELEGRKDKSFYYFANLAFSWMNGKTIPEMILDIERYKTEKNEE